LIQILGRKFAQLPITLLEINTVAHVGVALSLYVVWWKKPQDVEEYTEISFDASLAAFMSSWNFRKSFKRVFIQDSSHGAQVADGLDNARQDVLAETETNTGQMALSLNKIENKTSYHQILRAMRSFAILVACFRGTIHNFSPLATGTRQNCGKD